jgi:hypothetical protein
LCPSTIRTQVHRARLVGMFHLDRSNFRVHADGLLERTAAGAEPFTNCEAGAPGRVRLPELRSSAADWEPTGNASTAGSHSTTSRALSRTDTLRTLAENSQQFCKGASWTANENIGTHKM